MSDLPKSPAAETAAAAPALAIASPRKLRWKPVILIALGVAVLAWLVHFAIHAYHYEETDDAYVSGHLYQISPQVSAQVQAVLVNDNQTVKAGDVLVRLDPLAFTLATQKARNELLQSQAQETGARAALSLATTFIDEAVARAKQAEAQIGQTKAQLALAKLTLDRDEQLFAAGGVIAQSDLDTARSACQVAQAAEIANEANLAAAQATVASAQSGLASLQARVDAAVATSAASQSAVKDAERTLAYATLTAPADGRVGDKAVEIGNHVAIGQTLMSIASPDAWIIANFKETQLTHMSPGQAVTITLDTQPGLDLHGVIDSISPASGSQFALLPPDNATGNFNKVVQRVPVKILLDDASKKALGDGLRLGLSVVVDVRIR